MIYWYEHNFPFNLLFDLSNVVTIFLITLLVCNYFKVKTNLKLICLVSCFTPFLFNGFLFEWTLFPDQTKYINNCRTDNCKVAFDNLPLSTQNIIYAFGPIPFMEGFKSVAFINRLLLIFLVLYLYLKKFNREFILLLLFLPSMILYSSISLRDTFTIILALLMVNFCLEKKYYFTFLVFLIFYLVKPNNAIFIGIILTTYNFIFLNKGKRLSSFLKNNKYLWFILFSFFIYSYLGSFFEIVNHKRIGFYDENFNPGSYATYIEGLDFVNIKNFIFIYFKSLFNFIISPIKNIFSSFGIILIIDTLILYMITFYFFKKVFYKDLRIFNFWFISLVFLISIYSLLIFNDGTIHRYKLSIFIPIIFGLIKSARLKGEK